MKVLGGREAVDEHLVDDRACAPVGVAGGDAVTEIVEVGKQHGAKDSGVARGKNLRQSPALPRIRMPAHLPRRTFAIISHPDAGKTTLTEKFLLYGGAVALAG